MQNNMLAMILAGGRGSRLKDLTTRVENRQFIMAENTVSLTSRSVTVQTAASMW